ncbi:MAG: hypothetical protein LBT97_01320 [Planctomycetota bacterium]|nr:hypothetical protein [Planctomycetota bacterium]
MKTAFTIIAFAARERFVELAVEAAARLRRPPLAPGGCGRGCGGLELDYSKWLWRGFLEKIKQTAV